MRGPLAAVLILMAALAPALAGERRRCDVPLADWQPREALQSKFESEGWTVLAVRSDHGCYKVKAHNARGEMLEGRFDPATLERVVHDDDDDRDHDRDRDRDHDRRRKDD